jgi:hypothetical protein
LRRLPGGSYLTRTSADRMSSKTLRLFAICLLTLPLYAQQAEGEDMPSYEVESIRILRSLRDPRAPAPGVLGHELASLGIEIATPLFAILESRKVPGLGKDAPQQLSERQLEAILVSMEEFGSRHMMPLLSKDPAGMTSVATRRAVIDLLGAVGESSELSVLFTQGLLEEEKELHRSLEPRLRTALASILTRDSRAFEVIRAIWPRLPEAILPAVILGIGESDDPLGVEVLGEMYHFNSSHELLILGQISQVAPSSQTQVNRELVEKIVGKLGAEDRRVKMAVCLALGRLEAASCVPHLIELVNSEDKGLRQNAHWALKELLNLDFAASVGLWRYWFKAEEQWLAREYPQVIAGLNDPREATVRSSLRSISGHQLNRHELAMSVGEVLDNRSEAVCLEACKVLEGLGSRWAIASLITALEDKRPLVREAALRALSVITGEKLTEDPEDWAHYRDLVMN